MSTTATAQPVQPIYDIRHSLHLLIAPGQTVELRGKNVCRWPNQSTPSRTCTGYYTDLGRMAGDAAAITSAEAMWFTLNPVAGDLMAKANHTFASAQSRMAAGDDDIIHRHWLLIDFDPIRKKESGEPLKGSVSSTDREKECARQAARRVYHYLINTLGWPANSCLIADSGNGYHLLFRINLPNDEASCALVAACLKALSEQFTDADVEVDEKLANASRVCKLYGTWACKGSDWPNENPSLHRPWRQSRIIHVPEGVNAFADFAVVQAHQLDALASTVGVTVSEGEAVTARSVDVHPTADTGGADVVDSAAATASTVTRHKKGKQCNPRDASLARQCLKHLDPDMQYNDWIRVAMALKSVGESLRRDWIEWSRRGQKWREFEPEQKWDSFDDDGGITLGTLIKMARDAGMNLSQAMSDVRNECGLVLTPGDHLDAAREFMAAHEATPFVSFCGSFYRFDESRYRLVDGLRMRKYIYDFLADAKVYSGDRLKPMDVAKHTVDGVLDALRSTCLIECNANPPLVLSDGDAWTPSKDLIVANANHLNVRTGELRPNDHRIFAPGALPFDIDQAAAYPQEWAKFLNSIWPDDPDSIKLLQMWFGYVISGRTNLQKALMVVGPPRSGKGTIVKVLTTLMGNAACQAVTLSSLSERFGLEPLVGKALALIPDARLDHRNLNAATVERLVSITGEDQVNIDRKYKTQVFMSIGARIMMCTNELPSLKDTSTALANRFVLLRMTRSFLGAEDINLFQRLVSEMPGILNWALEGWRMLEHAPPGEGLITPHSASGLAETFLEGSSPIHAFVQDRCEIAMGAMVSFEELYNAYKTYCKCDNVDAGSMKHFSMKMMAAVPFLERKKTRIDGKQKTCFQGIRLRNFDVECLPQVAA